MNDGPSLRPFCTLPSDCVHLMAYDGRIYAACSDGTAYEINPDGHWRRIEPLPWVAEDIQ